MSKPLWLSAAPMQVLLNHLVDKLDAARQQERELVRAIRLDARSFPHLFKADFEEEKERLWAHLTILADWGWLAIKLDRAKPGQAPYQRNPRVNVLDEAALREAVNRPGRERSTGELWREAVEKYLVASEEAKLVVSRYRLEMPGRSAEDVVRRLNGLAGLVNEPLLLREVSARLVWGLSKVLDGRQALVATLLGLEECPFPEMPVMLQVFLPPSGFTGVLFIENLATFEQATRDGAGRYAGLALVYAAGFKGSARRLRSATGASVYFAAHGTVEERQTSRFLAWLRAGARLPCWFWGDLDHAGMRILAALRGVFDDASAWEPGYGPMLARLQAGQGHAAESGAKTGQQPIGLTGCAYADLLLIPAIAATGHFLDQEVG